MIERNTEIDDLVGRIILAEHFCSRDIQEPEGSEKAGEVRVWMEINDFDQAPIAQTAGQKYVLRSVLSDLDPDRPVSEVAMDTHQDHWLEGATPLRQSLEALAQREWLLVKSGTELIGILTRHDLASPLIGAYLLARLLGLEHCLRRLYGSFSHQPLTDEPGAHGEKGISYLSELLIKVGKQQNMREALGYRSRKHFESETGFMAKLRNDLAHGRSILSLENSPAEAVKRIQRMEALTVEVGRLLRDREDVWNAFAATEILSLDDTGMVWAGQGATALPLPAPVHIVTAQNPHEQVLTMSENNRRHQLLRRYLQMRFPTAELMEVVGKSCSGPWSEASWAISGLSRMECLALARRFQQRAIFELNATEMIVISANGQERRRTLRCR